MKKLLCGICLALAVAMMAGCSSVEEDYEYVFLYLNSEQGFNPFTFGDVNLVVNDDRQMYNSGSDIAELVFVKDLVYRIQMINKIPESGWSDTVDYALQYGFVGRLQKDDGSYEYCRFYVYTIDYDANADQFALIKYQRQFKL